MAHQIWIVRNLKLITCTEWGPNFNIKKQNWILILMWSMQKKALKTSHENSERNEACRLESI